VPKKLRVKKNQLARESGEGLPSKSMDRLSIIHKKSMKLIEKETGGFSTAGKSLMRLERGDTHDSPNGGGSLKKSAFFDSAVDLPNKHSGNSPGNQSI
jgi:hypothetical protein